MTLELILMRTLVQKMGWHHFMMDVGSLLAEQADKTSGKQSSMLFAASNTVHALSEAWTDCGRFEYPEDMVVDIQKLARLLGSE